MSEQSRFLQMQTNDPEYGCIQNVNIRLVIDGFDSYSTHLMLRSGMVE